MANILGSEEVYKFKQKWFTEYQPELRVVRSMWVCGAYRPPYYIDIHLNIKEIKSTKAQYLDYYTKSENTYEAGIIQLVDLGVTAPKIVRYHQKTENLYDSVLQLVDCGVVKPTLVPYTRREEGTYDSVLQLVGFGVSAPTDIHTYRLTYTKQPPQITIVMKQLSSTTAKISDST